MLPRETILRNLVRHLRRAVPRTDDVPHFKVRHWRNRSPAKAEWPCISVRYMGDDAPGVTRPTDGEIISTAEEVMELGVELIADAELPAEADDDEEDPAGDPTGLAVPSRMLETMFDALWTPGEQAESLDGTVWDIRYDGTGETEDNSTPDNVRLAERIVLVYRVRSDAPHHLLVS